MAPGAGFPYTYTGTWRRLPPVYLFMANYLDFLSIHTSGDSLATPAEHYNTYNTNNVHISYILGTWYHMCEDVSVFRSLVWPQSYAEYNKSLHNSVFHLWSFSCVSSLTLAFRQRQSLPCFASTCLFPCFEGYRYKRRCRSIAWTQGVRPRG